MIFLYLNLVSYMNCGVSTTKNIIVRKQRYNNKIKQRKALQFKKIGVLCLTKYVLIILNVKL